MKRARIPLLFAAAIAGTLFLVALVMAAGVTIKPEPPSFELHSLPDGKLVPGPWPTTAALCATMGENLVKAGQLADFMCVTRVKYTVAKNCDGEPAPAVTLVQVDRDGGKYWEIPTGAIAPPVPSEANGWAVMVWAYVQNAAANPYPNCWVRGWAPESEWRLNPNYPNAPKLEKIVPGMADVIEPPNSIEPVCKPDGTEDCPVSPT